MVRILQWIVRIVTIIKKGVGHPYFEGNPATLKIVNPNLFEVVGLSKPDSRAVVYPQSNWESSQVTLKAVNGVANNLFLSTTLLLFPKFDGMHNFESSLQTNCLNLWSCNT